MSKVVDFSKHQIDQHNNNIMNEMLSKIPSYMQKMSVVNGKVQKMFSLEGIIHFLHVMDNPTPDVINYLYYMGNVVSYVLKNGKYSSEDDEFYKTMFNNKVFQMFNDMSKGVVYGKKY